MKSGKVSESVLKRSVLRPLLGAGAVFAAGSRSAGGFPGEDCQLWQSAGPQTGITSVCGTLGGCYDRDMEMFLNSIVNNLAAGGVQAEAVSMNIMLPAGTEESRLGEYARQAGAACAARRLKIAGGHTEAGSVLESPVISITGFGSKIAERKQLRPSCDLVMAGWIGMAGTVILAQNREEELLKRYPFSLVDGAKGIREHLMIVKAAEIGNAAGVTAMHDVSSGGIFGALWEMTEAAGVGMEADLKKLPVRQETIEISDFFGINPYQLYGQGALLFGTEEGGALVLALQAAGIPAAVIGRTTAGNDRILRNGEEQRFLERPQQDALWKLADAETGTCGN
ncbi:MAG: AIR synthase-related protein [Lachnospiraceae bacterium]|nr:AIR synthase-related protein [Lachnospiraceae bacterium]MDD3794367.1 AIR synthase-related protein [Lachnospiraceae bacterium]